VTSKPVRLRYNDATDGMTTIGSMFTGNDNINTVTIKNSAEEFNKVIIEGRNDLQEALPVSQQEFGLAQNGESEPEILVEVFDNDSWSVRERCYAVEGGSVDDNGNYKNKKLYGHEKYTGEKRVETATITTDIEACMEELIPSGYSLQVPGNVTVPNVNEWSYKGRRENGYLELTRNYNWVLMFTSDLNANNDYIVRFEPSGYGGSEGNIVRGQDPIVYDYWKKKDTKTVVSEVTVKGEAPDGSTVDVTRTANSPDLERSVTLNIGYPVTVTEAEDIGDNLLQPSFVEHGALQGPLFLDNTVNFTVGILDSELNIDDEFTVVEQKDFLHEGQTYFSFEFENEANIRESIRNKGLQEERDTLFPTGEDSINIDFDNFNAENSDTNADVSTTEDDQSPDIEGETDTDTGEGNYSFAEAGASVIDGADVRASTEAVSFTGKDTEYFLVTLNFSFEGDPGNVTVEIINDTDLATYFLEGFRLVQSSTTRTVTIIQSEDISGDTIEGIVTNNTGNGASISVDLTVDSIAEHTHGTSGVSNGSMVAANHNHNVSASDGGHGGPTSGLEHVITGDQAQQLINLLQELKTDR